VRGQRCKSSAQAGIALDNCATRKKHKRSANPEAANDGSNKKDRNGLTRDKIKMACQTHKIEIS